MKWRGCRAVCLSTVRMPTKTHVVASRLSIRGLSISANICAAHAGFKWQSERVEAYFLSHFHGDHYDGLNENFQGPGLIHCTKITAALVIQELGVHGHLVCSYEIGETAHVCGARVTFLDANHCPGAAMLLFHLADGVIHLHCGDMRYDPRMAADPALLAVRSKIDKLYLDTTYCHPKHVFPHQQAKYITYVSSLSPYYYMCPHTIAIQLHMCPHNIASATALNRSNRRHSYQNSQDIIPRGVRGARRQ